MTESALRRTLVAVMGPTASGKTALAVGLARAMGGALINADSRQAVAELSVDRVIDAMPYVLGKLVAPPDGTSVTWEVTGPVVREVTAVVEDGRAHLLLRPGEAPVATSPPVGRSPSQVEAAARITCDTEVFCCLGLGRGEPLGYLEAGRVHITGDEELGRRVVTSMGFMI